MIEKYKIDLFSDTNCSVSPEMRSYMLKAEVGNEVAGEDPTVNHLLERVCDLLGKEAAVFMPSGTMCNGVAFRVLCKRPGDTIILDKTAHPLWKASGLVAGLSQAMPYLVDGERGIFSVEQVWPLKTIQDLCELAHKNNIKTHMDGARLFNAVVETGVSAADYAAPFDSVWVDFCKGLGAPMGAVLAGSKAFIEEAWYYKFQQGGGLHKAGILAAGCLYGLDNNLSKIKTVHRKAKELAKSLAQIPYILLNPAHVEANMIFLEIDHPALSAFDMERYLKRMSIRTLAVDDRVLRMICHLDITNSDVEEVYRSVLTIFESAGNASSS